MRITISPTERFFMAGQVMVRVWEGEGDTGQPVFALVAAVAGGLDESELVSIPPPDRAEAERWATKILGGEVDWAGDP